jgi:transposase
MYMSETPVPPASDPPFSQGSLFELPPAAPAPPPAPPRGTPRLRRAQRDQVELRLLALDQLLPEDHEARAVWAYVEQLDLQHFLRTIRAVQGRAGRDATDPKILVVLWLFATLQGVGSARALDGLCQEHLAYQWLAGGVSLNYHTLSDFRVDHAEALDDLLTQSVAVLRTEGLVSLEQVAQDGVRVRATPAAVPSVPRPRWRSTCTKPRPKSRPSRPSWKRIRRRPTTAAGKRGAGPPTNGSSGLPRPWRTCRKWPPASVKTSATRRGSRRPTPRRIS